MTGLDALLSRPRYEVFPGKGTEQAVVDWVPAGMTVTVTASPVKGLAITQRRSWAILQWIGSMSSS